MYEQGIESKLLFIVLNPRQRISNKIVCHVLRKRAINNFNKPTFNS